MVPGHRTCHIPVYPLVHTAVFRISDLCQLVYVILWVPDDSVVCLRVSGHGAVVLNMYHVLACLTSIIASAYFMAGFARSEGWQIRQSTADVSERTVDR